jgi:mannose-6-phosphate isomerase
MEQLTPTQHKKVWGSTQLEPWFPNSQQRIGEIWFSASDELPLLVKFLFTLDNLSVQVHPDDDYARAHENSRGKTEMWHILRADPGARIALGFKCGVTPEELREAALSGAIVDLLQWIPAEAGQTFFTPAGTVHAIGGGLALCEIQEHSDVTYRLYDWGRIPPRTLHLEQSLAVSHRQPHPGMSVPRQIGPGRQRLVVCDHFTTELWEFAAKQRHTPNRAGTELFIVLEGSGHFDGEPFAAGQVWRAHAGESAIKMIPEKPVRLLRTWA